MTTFALVPGAGGDATQYYGRVTPLLEAAGHDAGPIDLPADDRSAGLPVYADLVVKATRDRTDVVLVAQSFGGFTTPLLQRTPLRAQVLVDAMIPKPGKRANEWWQNTGAVAARRKAAGRHAYSGAA
jgi:hypothetical protein